MISIWENWHYFSNCSYKEECIWYDCFQGSHIYTFEYFWTFVLFFFKNEPIYNYLKNYSDSFKPRFMNQESNTEQMNQE